MKASTPADPASGNGSFVRADWRLIHEYYTGMCAHMLHATVGKPLALQDPERIVVFEDHTSYLGESPAHVRGVWCKSWWKCAADDGSNAAGISHAMMAEHYALPCLIVVGRSGPGMVWLASSPTVAASAIAGRLVSFEELQAAARGKGPACPFLECPPTAHHRHQFI